MALDTAWPWVNDTYGLGDLRAYFVRINLYAEDHALLFLNRDSYGVLAAKRNELTARAFERVSVLVLVLNCGPGCWCCELAERASKTGGGAGAGAAAGVVSWQSALRLVSADCGGCGGAVSWLVVGFCLAIWVYAGLIYV